MSGAMNNPYLENRDDLLRIMTAPNAGAHNAIYRGKFLGTSATAAQYEAIAAGTFDDLYIGDYWTIGGENYQLAAFDYCLSEHHHVVIVPDRFLYTAQMNTTNVTTAGYAGSAMYKSNLAQAKTTIKAAFGSSHILTKREILTTAADVNGPYRWAWFDSDVELMSEVQLYGTLVTSHSSFNVGTDNGQFPLFMLDRTTVHNKTNYWLRDVSSNNAFACIDTNGVANTSDASAAMGVRPYFCIY